MTNDWKWVMAKDIRNDDVLYFLAGTSDGMIDGIPIERINSNDDGQIEVVVRYSDGTERYKAFEATDSICIRKRDHHAS